MNRKQAKVWAKLSKSELQSIDRGDLAKWYEVLVHFANGGDIEYKMVGEWRITLNPSFNSASEFRIEPETHIVNGFEVPAPNENSTQSVLYVPCFHNSCGHFSVICGTQTLICRKVLFETPEAARANALAMLGIDPSTYKE